MERLLDAVVRYGLPLIFVNVFLEQIGLPIPALPTLVVAGALSASGRLSAPRVFLLAIAASLLADFIWYALGRRFGSRILKTLCRISLSPDSCVQQTESLFEDQGMPSLLYAKFVPGLSTVAPPLAGAMRARALEFFLYDAGGSALWAGAGVAGGLIFHGAIGRVGSALEGMGFWALVVVGAGLAAFIGLKWWQRRTFYRALRLARISPAELQTLFKSGENPLVFDVRTAGAFRRDPRRIPAALRLEIDGLAAAVRDLPRDRDIILYCT